MLHKAFLMLPFLVILYCVFRAYRLNRGWHCAYCGNSDALDFHPTCNLFDHPSPLVSLRRLNHLRIMFRPGTLLLHCLFFVLPSSPSISGDIKTSKSPQTMFRCQSTSPRGLAHWVDWNSGMERQHSLPYQKCCVIGSASLFSQHRTVTSIHRHGEKQLLGCSVLH